MSVLENLEPTKRIYHCRVKVVRAKLDENDKKIFDEALANEQKWTPYGLSQALIKRGIKIFDKPIKKHREGTCSCSKE